MIPHLIPAHFSGYTVPTYLLTFIEAYTPVRGRIKEARWVLKKISPGVIKNNTQWFWCQTISIHQSFLYFSNAFRLPLLHEQNNSDVWIERYW